MAFDTLKQYKVKISADTAAFLKELNELEDVTTKKLKDANLTEGLRNDIEKLSDEIKGMKTSLKNSTDEINKNITKIKTDEMVKEFKTMQESISSSMDEAKKSVTELYDFLNNPNAGKSFASGLGKQFDDLKDTVINTVNSLGLISKTLDQILSGQKDFSSFEQLEKSLTNINNGTSKAASNVAKQAQNIKKSTKTTKAALAEQVAAFESAKKQLNTATMDDITSLINGNATEEDVATMIEYIKIIRELNDAYKQLPKNKKVELGGELPVDIDILLEYQKALVQIKNSFLNLGDTEKQIRFTVDIGNEDSEGKLIEKVNRIVDIIQKRTKPVTIPIAYDFQYNDKANEKIIEEADKHIPEGSDKKFIKSINLSIDAETKDLYAKVNDAIDELNAKFKQNNAKKINVQIAGKFNSSVDKAIDDIQSEIYSREIEGDTFKDSKGGKVIANNVNGNFTINPGNLATEQTLSNIRDILKEIGAKGLNVNLDGSSSTSSEAGLSADDEKLYNYDAAFRIYRKNTAILKEQTERAVLIDKMLSENATNIKAQAELKEIKKMAAKGDIEAFHATDYYSKSIKVDGKDISVFGKKELTKWQAEQDALFNSVHDNIKNAKQETDDYFKSITEATVKNKQYISEISVSETAYQDAVKKVQEINTNREKQRADGTYTSESAIIDDYQIKEAQKVITLYENIKADGGQIVGSGRNARMQTPAKMIYEWQSVLLEDLERQQDRELNQNFVKYKKKNAEKIKAIAEFEPTLSTDQIATNMIYEEFAQRREKILSSSNANDFADDLKLLKSRMTTNKTGLAQQPYEEQVKRAGKAISTVSENLKLLGVELKEGTNQVIHKKGSVTDPDSIKNELASKLDFETKKYTDKIFEQQAETQYLEKNKSLMLEIVELTERQNAEDFTDVDEERLKTITQELKERTQIVADVEKQKEAEKVIAELREKQIAKGKLTKKDQDAYYEAENFLRSNVKQIEDVYAYSKEQLQDIDDVIKKSQQRERTLRNQGIQSKKDIANEYTVNNFTKQHYEASKRELEDLKKEQSRYARAVDTSASKKIKYTLTDVEQRKFYTDNPKRIKELTAEVYAMEQIMQLNEGNLETETERLTLAERIAKIKEKQLPSVAEQMTEKTKVNLPLSQETAKAYITNGDSKDTLLAVEKELDDNLINTFKKSYSELYDMFTDETSELFISDTEQLKKVISNISNYDLQTSNKDKELSEYLKSAFQRLDRETGNAVRTISEDTIKQATAIMSKGITLRDAGYKDVAKKELDEDIKALESVLNDKLAKRDRLKEHGAEVGALSSYTRRHIVPIQNSIDALKGEASEEKLDEIIQENERLIKQKDELIEKIRQENGLTEKSVEIFLKANSLKTAYQDKMYDYSNLYGEMSNPKGDKDGNIHNEEVTIKEVTGEYVSLLSKRNSLQIEYNKLAEKYETLTKEGKSGEAYDVANRNATITNEMKSIDSQLSVIKEKYPLAIEGLEEQLKEHKQSISSARKAYNDYMKDVKTNHPEVYNMLKDKEMNLSLFGMDADGNIADTDIAEAEKRTVEIRNNIAEILKLSQAEKLGSITDDEKERLEVLYKEFEQKTKITKGQQQLNALIKESIQLYHEQRRSSSGEITVMSDAEIAAESDRINSAIQQLLYADTNNASQTQLMDLLDKIESNDKRIAYFSGASIGASSSSKQAEGKARITTLDYINLVNTTNQEVNSLEESILAKKSELEQVVDAAEKARTENIEKANKGKKAGQSTKLKNVEDQELRRKQKALEREIESLEKEQERKRKELKNYQSEVTEAGFQLDDDGNVITNTLRDRRIANSVKRQKERDRQVESTRRNTKEKLSTIDAEIERKEKEQHEARLEALKEEEAKTLETAQIEAAIKEKSYSEKTQIKHINDKYDKLQAQQEEIIKNETERFNLLQAESKELQSQDNIYNKDIADKQNVFNELSSQTVASSTFMPQSFDAFLGEKYADLLQERKESERSLIDLNQKYNQLFNEGKFDDAMDVQDQMDKIRDGLNAGYEKFKQEYAAYLKNTVLSYSDKFNQELQKIKVGTSTMSDEDFATLANDVIQSADFYTSQGGKDISKGQGSVYQDAQKYLASISAEHGTIVASAKRELDLALQRKEAAIETNRLAIEAAKNNIANAENELKLVQRANEEKKIPIGRKRQEDLNSVFSEKQIKQNSYFSQDQVGKKVKELNRLNEELVELRHNILKVDEQGRQIRDKDGNELYTVSKDSKEFLHMKDIIKQMLVLKQDIMSSLNLSFTADLTDEQVLTSVPNIDDVLKQFKTRTNVSSNMNKKQRELSYMFDYLLKEQEGLQKQMNALKVKTTTKKGSGANEKDITTEQIIDEEKYQKLLDRYNFNNAFMYSLSDKDGKSIDLRYRAEQMGLIQSKLTGRFILPEENRDTEIAALLKEKESLQSTVQRLKQVSDKSFDIGYESKEDQMNKLQARIDEIQSVVDTYTLKDDRGNDVKYLNHDTYFTQYTEEDRKNAEAVAAARKAEYDAAKKVNEETEETKTVDEYREKFLQGMNKEQRKVAEKLQEINQQYQFQLKLRNDITQMSNPMRMNDKQFELLEHNRQLAQRDVLNTAGLTLNEAGYATLDSSTVVSGDVSVSKIHDTSGFATESTLKKIYQLLASGKVSKNIKGDSGSSGKGKSKKEKANEFAGLRRKFNDELRAATTEDAKKAIWTKGVQNGLYLREQGAYFGNQRGSSKEDIAFTEKFIKDNNIQLLKAVDAKVDGAKKDKSDYVPKLYDGQTKGYWRGLTKELNAVIQNKSGKETEETIATAIKNGVEKGLLLGYDETNKRSYLSMPTEDNHQKFDAYTKQYAKDHGIEVKPIDVVESGDVEDIQTVLQTMMVLQAAISQVTEEIEKLKAAGEDATAKEAELVSLTGQLEQMQKSSGVEISTAPDNTVDTSTAVAQVEKEAAATEEKVEELQKEYEVKKSLAQINAQLGKSSLSDETRTKWNKIAEFNGYGIDSKTGLAVENIQKENQTPLRDPSNMTSAELGIKLGTYPNEWLQKYLDGVKAETPEMEQAFKVLAEIPEEMIRDVLEIHSPSEVMKRLGRWTGQGFADGVMESSDTVKKAIQQMLASGEITEDEVKSLIGWDGKMDDGKSMFKRNTNVGKQAWNSLQGALSDKDLFNYQKQAEQSSILNLKQAREMVSKSGLTVNVDDIRGLGEKVGNQWRIAENAVKEYIAKKQEALSSTISQDNAAEVQQQEATETTEVVTNASNEAAQNTVENQGIIRKELAKTSDEYRAIQEIAKESEMMTGALDIYKMTSVNKKGEKSVSYQAKDVFGNSLTMGEKGENIQFSKAREVLNQEAKELKDLMSNITRTLNNSMVQDMKEYMPELVPDGEKEDLAKLKMAYDELFESKEKYYIQRKDDFTDEEIQSMRDLLDVIDEVKKKFSGEAVFLGQLSGDQASNLPLTLKALAQATEKNAIQNIKFGESNREMTYQVKGANKMLNTYKITVDNTGKAFKKLMGSEKYVGKLAATWQAASKKFKEIGLYMLSSVSIYQIVNFFKRGLTVVKEFDTAMTELQKVSHDTAQELQNFGKEAFNIAKQIGSTGVDIINSAADWEKLGYSIEEASELAKNSALYANVGSMDIGTATEHLVSTLKAFNIEAENSINIVDKFNEIGNNYAITSEGIGAALERSAASLVAAGNDLDQSIALITAGNVISQDAESVGNAIKVMSLRIRGSKTDLEDMGESTDGLASSSSKLRDELKALTGVDIMLDDNTYKSTYDIIVEISKVWDQLSDVSQANVLERLAGRRSA